MKQIILCLIILFSGELLFSQKIILHTNNGSDQILYSSSIDSITFVPFACGDEVSYAGKTYGTVSIGTQCWMKENLDVGTMIMGTSNQLDNSILEKYCYNNLLDSCTTYGGLYQWNEMMQYVTTPGAKGICSDGWHIPTESELQTLKTAVGNSSNALKAIGQGSVAGSGTNTSGFSALLAGQRSTFGGNLCFMGSAGYFWSSTQFDGGFYRIDLYSNDNLFYFIHDTDNYGFSVRCIKD